MSQNTTERPKLNRTWHEMHPMPDRPTLEDRIAWHSEHALHCGCRAMPENIRLEIERRRKKEA